MNIDTGLIGIGGSEISENYFCNLVEKFILAATKRFAEDLIRQTCSHVFNNSVEPTPSLDLTSKKPAKSDLPPPAQGDRIQTRKFPMDVYVNDVFSTIASQERYDFLTNKHMAQPVAKPNSEEPNDDAFGNDQ